VHELGLDKLRCEHQLYVDGRSLTGPGLGQLLLRDPPAGPPRSVVPEELILRLVGQPRSYQRGYLAIQVIDWDGDVVVTMFVRAVLERELLHLEIAVHALPEVIWRGAEDDGDDDDFERYLRGATIEHGTKQGGRRQRRPAEIAPTRAAAIRRGLALGTRTYWTALAGAAPRCGRAALRPVARFGRNRRHRLHTGSGGAFEFGAETSLREHLAMGQRMHHNAFDDALGHLRRLQHRLMNVFAGYLTSRDIDPKGFVEEAAKAIQNVQQFIFNNLNAGAMTFGSNSPATGTVNAANQPPSGAAPQAGTS
jgi:hypothetical protein